MSALKDRLAEARTEAGLSQAQLAKAVGAGQSTIASIENGRNKGSSLFLDLARALNVNVEWLMDGAGPKRGEGGPTPPPKSAPAAPWPFPSISEEDVRALPAAHINELQGALALAIAQLKLRVQVAATPVQKPASSTRGSVVDTHAADDAFPMPDVLDKPVAGSGKISVTANVTTGARVAANDSFEPVPELADVRLAAGDGIENHAEDQTGVIQFRRSFLRSVGADAGKALVVYAKGDSMEPVIKDGAALLVVPNEDLTIRDLAAGGVYAINYDGKMIVKTVAKDKLTGRWVARSFNPAYPDIPLENGHPARVLGQVVWAGARLRDDEPGQWVRS
ncbi:S24 family peptidase [Achromobacter spanius]|uniref:S24 family peptidase n=1 Tax=Achromobacter spanius TaxID=217203 RepID=UPI0036EEFFBF